MPTAPFNDADLRTLSLARSPTTPDRIDRYLAYQRGLIAALAEPEASLASAHPRALEDSGLTAAEHPNLAAMCRAFAGRQVTIRRLRDLLREAEAQGAQEKVERLRPELDRLASDTTLARRWGEELHGWLQEREETLVTLHERLQRVEVLPLRPSRGAG